MEDANTTGHGSEPARQEHPRGSAPPDDASHGGDARDQKHQRHERYYWIVTGAASVAATIATIVAAIYAIGAYNASWQAVGAAQDQAEIARKSLVAGERPWVMLTNFKPIGLFSDDSEGVTFSVNISAKNVGHSPAQNVFVSGKLLIEGFDPPAGEVMESVCRDPHTGDGMKIGG